MRKRILSVIAMTFLMIALSAFCVSALEVTINESNAAVKATGDGEVKYYDSLYDAWNKSSHYGDFEIQLLKDVKISKQMTVGDVVNRESTVTLDLNGHKIDAQGKGRVFYIQQIMHTVFGGQNELIIEDTAGGGIIENGNADVCGGFALVGGCLTIRGGTIRNCSSTGEIQGTGGAVFLVAKAEGFLQKSGKLVLEGDAVIEDCEATSGGAVYAEGGTEMVMDGGTIRGCHANDRGGAVYCADPGGSCDIKNGLIENCTCGDSGGGIYLASGSGLGMDDGEIRGCSAKKKGGAVYADTGSYADVTDPRSKVKGAYVKITGGTITENHADKYGGGIYMESSDGVLAALDLPVFKIKGDVDITGNTGPKRIDTSVENNIYLDKDDDGECRISIIGGLDGKIGVNMDKRRTFAEHKGVTLGDQTEHIYSDYRNWEVVKNGTKYAMEMAQPEIKSIKLVTNGKDNSNARYDIDEDKHEAVINVGRELDCSAFGYEQLKIEWIGEDFIDTNTDKVLTSHENPMRVSMFGVSGEGAAYDEYYSVASEGKDPVKWHIVLKGVKPITEVKLMVYDTSVYDAESGKQLHGSIDGDGPENITVKPGQKIRIEAVVPEGKEFDYWGGRLEDLEDVLQHTNPEEFEMPACDIGIQPSFK